MEIVTDEPDLGARIVRDDGTEVVDSHVEDVDERTGEVTKVVEFAQGWDNPFSPPEGVTDDDGGFAPVTGQGRWRGTGARDLREQRTALAGRAPGPDGQLPGPHPPSGRPRRACHAADALTLSMPYHRVGGAPILRTGETGLSVPAGRISRLGSEGRAKREELG